MDFFALLSVVSAVSGLVLAALLCLVPRCGPPSRLLSLFFVPGALAAALVGLGPLIPGWTTDRWTILSFSCVLLCAAGGCLSSYTIERQDYAAQLRKRKWLLGAITAAAPAIILFFLPPVWGKIELFGNVRLGLPGYVAAMYLLLTSVVALGNIEQTLRGIPEHLRWEIKFLLLGMAASLCAIVYIASTILLYTPESAFLSPSALRLFPVIFLLSCALVFHAWRRGAGRSPVIVSQGVIYSTITLTGVGVYLVGSAAMARWVSQWQKTGIPTEPVVFILCLVALSAVLLGTAFRHRARRWIRRHVFAGRYDYRRFWMDATAQVGSIESVAAAAAGFAELIEKALGSLDISIWVQSGKPGVMRLIAARGTISEGLPAEIVGLAHRLDGLTEPISVNELPVELAAGEWPGFLARSKASVLAPLTSSGRLVGLLTVGSDRSGKPFDWETREFLRVMAVHFANEFHKAELLATLVEAREAQAFQTFSTFLLHDLKNFASTLSLITKNATRHHGNPGFQLDAFQSIVEISEKMKKLCNSLRTFSSALAANKTPDDLNSIVGVVAESFHGNLGRSLHLDLGSIPKARVDREEIRRVLQNLILNAHEASAEGSVIRLTTRHESRGIVMSVADSGCGVRKDYFEKAMSQPFQTTKPDGLGIGLFQSKKIVEAHGGKIEVESAEGVGTTVYVLLPAIEYEELAAEQSRLYPDEMSIPMALSKNL